MTDFCFRCLRRDAVHVALERRLEVPICDKCLRNGDTLWLDDARAVATVDRGCSA